VREVAIDDVQAAYKRHSVFYDLYCGALLQPGREKAIARMGCRPGDRVLEVGVGTGLSLPLYPRGVRVTGIDVSGPMLRQAEERRRRERLEDVSLCEMDGERLAFADDSFDKVVAMYVASVVPHPARLVAEMRRVCRDEDGLFFLNHFHSDNPLVGRAERLLAPLSGVLGFRPDFALDDFVDRAGLEIVDLSPAGHFGYWKLLQARPRRAAAA
jgi:phosphatidylethanolamine/phosphatidyl-N-methylethanolamine N-methyltransferase